MRSERLGRRRRARGQEVLCACKRSGVGSRLEVAPSLFRVADVDDERHDAEDHDKAESHNELDGAVFTPQELPHALNHAGAGPLVQVEGQLPENDVSAAVLGAELVPETSIISVAVLVATLLFMNGRMPVTDSSWYWTQIVMGCGPFVSAGPAKVF